MEGLLRASMRRQLVNVKSSKSRFLSSFDLYTVDRYDMLPSHASVKSFYELVISFEKF